VLPRYSLQMKELYLAGCIRMFPLHLPPPSLSSPSPSICIIADTITRATFLSVTGVSLLNTQTQVGQVAGVSLCFVTILFALYALVQYLKRMFGLKVQIFSLSPLPSSPSPLLSLSLSSPSPSPLPLPSSPSPSPLPLPSSPSPLLSPPLPLPLLFSVIFLFLLFVFNIVAKFVSG
jgi:hypothetical protein